MNHEPEHAILDALLPNYLLPGMVEPEGFDDEGALAEIRLLDRADFNALRRAVDRLAVLMDAERPGRGYDQSIERDGVHDS